MTATPVLWIHGPAGVGKTTVAWQVHAELTRSGAEDGYVDIDQLGMCHPEPESDPGRHRLAAANLAAVVEGHRAAGAGAVVVSGVVDPARGFHLDLLPAVALTTCRLRADGDELRRRLMARGAAPDYIARAVAEAEALDARDTGDLCIDTTGLPVDRVVALVRQRTAGWTDRSEAGTPRAAPGAADGPVLWVCGPTGVGKSTAGFNLYLRHVLGAKLAGAFVDLDQLGHYRRADHRVRAGILADMWQNFRRAGAQCLVVVGPAEDAAAIAAYTRALPAATITVCRLHASARELTRRIMLRGEGGSWAQPGDPLRGRTAAQLAAVADQAATQAAALERAAVGDVRITTDGLTADQVADAIIARVTSS